MTLSEMAFEMAKALLFPERRLKAVGRESVSTSNSQLAFFNAGRFQGVNLDFTVMRRRHCPDAASVQVSRIATASGRLPSDRFPH